MKSYGVTIQIKPLQQYFHMVLFIQFVVLTFESVDESTRHEDIIQNCNSDYIILFITLYNNTDFRAQKCSSTIFSSMHLSIFFTSVESLAEVSAPF